MNHDVYLVYKELHQPLEHQNVAHTLVEYLGPMQQPAQMSKSSLETEMNIEYVEMFI